MSASTPPRLRPSQAPMFTGRRPCTPPIGKPHIVTIGGRRYVRTRAGDAVIPRHYPPAWRITELWCDCMNMARAMGGVPAWTFGVPVRGVSSGGPLSSNLPRANVHEK